jgi:hypothetical protein
MLDPKRNLRVDQIAPFVGGIQTAKRLYGDILKFDARDRERGIDDHDRLHVGLWKANLPPRTWRAIEQGLTKAELSRLAHG